MLKTLLILVVLSIQVQSQFLDPQNAAIIAELKTIIVQNQHRNLEMLKQVAIEKAKYKISEKMHNFQKKLRSDLSGIEGLEIFDINLLEDILLADFDNLLNSVSTQIIDQNLDEFSRFITSKMDDGFKEFENSLDQESDFSIGAFSRKSNELEKEAIQMKKATIKMLSKHSMILKKQAELFKRKSKMGDLLSADRLDLVYKSNQLLIKSTEYQLKAVKMASDLSKFMLDQVGQKISNQEVAKSLKKENTKFRYGLFDSDLIR